MTLMKSKYWSCLFFILLIVIANVDAIAQLYKIRGVITLNDSAAGDVAVILMPAAHLINTNAAGRFTFENLIPGDYELIVHYSDTQTYHRKISVFNKNVSTRIALFDENLHQLQEVIFEHNGFKKTSGTLKDVEGTAIYAGKKTEVIHVSNLNVNLATNNARQIYSRAVGINIIEYDGGGLQLGIGGRGLNPSRVSNFNTRQNGYDISADALGYPESYYTPTTEALEKIELVRGAASLQYGTQFGGLINFQMKKGPADKLVEATSRQTTGSFGFFNSFNSVGGTVKKLNYYGYYQYKRGDGWRPNSHFDQHGAYLHLDYALTAKLKLTAEYTYMDYLAQLPGGLTDADFKTDPSQSVRKRNWFKVNWNLVSLSMDYQLGEHTKLNWRSYHLHASRTALGLLSYINRPDPGGVRDLQEDEYKNLGSELRFLHSYRLVRRKLSTLLAGVRVYKGLTQRQQGNADDGAGPDFKFAGGFPSSSSYHFPGVNVAVFTENVFKLSEQWTVTPGARFEFISTNAKGYYTTRSSPYPDFYYIRNNEAKHNNRAFVFFGIGTSFKPVSGMELYANISQNYRSVNFNDIRVVNQNARVDSLMTDERGYTADGGIKGNMGGWLRYDLSIFYLKYNKRIGSVNVKSSDSLETYRLRKNIGDSRNIGFESFIEADFLKLISNNTSRYKLSVYSNLALIDARYISSEDASVKKDNLVEFVPPMLFRTGLSFGNKHFDISYQYSYVGKQFSDATNTEFSVRAIDGIVPAYQVMDLNVSYCWKWITLFGTINNLADARYFTRRADGYPGPGILPSDPRTYYLTLQFKL